MDNKYKHLKNLNIEELVGQDKEVKPDYDKALKTIKNVRTAFASSKAIFNISLSLTPVSFFIILSTAHLRLIAVGLDAINSSLDFLRKDKSFFSIMDKTKP